VHATGKQMIQNLG